MSEITFILRMGKTIYFALLSVAVATHVYTQDTTGTAFIEASKRATFYQDTVRLQINVEIEAPRIQLDYTKYEVCDSSYTIDGTPMCRKLFGEFDDNIYDFLDLELVKLRKKTILEKQQDPIIGDVSTAAKRIALRDIHQKMSEEINSNYTETLKKHSTIRNRRSAPSTSENAKWHATIDYVYSEIALIKSETCSILSLRRYNKRLSLEAMILLCSTTSLASPEDYQTIDRDTVRFELQQKFQHLSEKFEAQAQRQSAYLDSARGKIYFFFNKDRKSEAHKFINTWTELSSRSAANAELLRQLTFSNVSPEQNSESILESMVESTTESTEESTTESTAESMAESMEEYTTKSIDKPINSTNIQSRKERSAAVGVAIGLTAIGTSIAGYFIGQSSTQLDLEKAREDIEKNKNAIIGLNKAVELNEDNIAEIAELLKLQPSMVLTGKSTLPMDIQYEASQIQNNGMKTRFDVNSALHISRLNAAEFIKFQKAVLTLQNSRLPLEKTFLLGLRAQCMALQTSSTIKETKFCNELSFYSTRWDTGLQFIGIGVTYLDEDETMIKSLVYSFSVDVPVLYADNLQEFDIINLGRFDSPSIINKIKLPPSGVVTKSGILHPLWKEKCIELDSSVICPTHAIGSYDECLQSVFRGQVALNCEMEKFPTQITCIGEIFETFALVSMWKPSTVHYGTSKSRHYHQNADVGTFDIVNRTNVNGVIFCEKGNLRHIAPELQIPPRKPQHSVKFTIAAIETTVQMLNLKTSNDRLSNLEHGLRAQREKLDKSSMDLKTKSYHTNSTLELVKSNVKNAITNLPSNIKEHIKHILIPIMTPIISILVLTFISVLSMMIIFKKCQRKMNERECFTVPNEPDQNNRMDQTNV